MVFLSRWGRPFYNLREFALSIITNANRATEMAPPDDKSATCCYAKKEGN